MFWESLSPSAYNEVGRFTDWLVNHANGDIANQGGLTAFAWDHLAASALDVANALDNRCYAGAVVAAVGFLVKPVKFVPFVPKVIKELTTQQQKAIRSLEKQIAKHEQKVQDFKDNPTVRPGMEHLPKEVIQKQHQRRIHHLETEINTFKNNIEKINQGEIDS